MAANFSPPPPLPPIAHRLQPELLPAGPLGIGVGAGKITATGTPIGLAFGQGFGVGAGQIQFAGAPVAVSLGVVQGLNVGAGQITYFGTTIGLTLPASGPAPVPAGDNVGFAPALSELAIDAWERLGKQSGELTTTHLNSMRRSMNFVLTRWANRGINLWRVSNASIPLLKGVATYSLPPTLIDMLDTYLSTTDGTAITTDIIMAPMSRDTYAALPQKSQQGRPMMYWFNRTIAPTVTVWPVPDQSYVMPYFALGQIGDCDPSGGNGPDLPYRFLEAFTAGVAAHLAQKWADPQRALALDAYAKEVFTEAADEDREKVTLSIAPSWAGLWN